VQLNYILHPSTILLIFANLLTIFIALAQNWDVFVLMILYVVQGLIIGGFHYLKTLNLKDFSARDFSKNFSLRLYAGRRAFSPPNIESLGKKDAKRKVANYFLAGYLLFHLVYIFFIFLIIIFGPSLTFQLNLGNSWQNNWDGLHSSGPGQGILVEKVLSEIMGFGFICAIIGFFIIHLVSYLIFRREQNGRVNLGKFVNEPFNRIYPIHIIIIISMPVLVLLKNPAVLLVIFLLLKTLLDVGLHIKQHSNYLSVD